MDVKISTQNFDIIDSGCVIVPNGQYLDFEFENLKFKISFIEEEQDGESPLVGRISAQTVNMGTDNAYYGITFYNQNQANFSSINDLINPATIDNKSLYLKFCIKAINRNNRQSDKIFFYTWLLSKEPATQITNNTTQSND